MIFAFAVFLAFFIFAIAFTFRSIRSKKIKLRPNCLLTEFPIVILQDNVKFSWRTDPYWYLDAHGYSVMRMSTDQFLRRRDELTHKFKGVHIFQNNDYSKDRLLQGKPIKSLHKTAVLSHTECLELAISLAESDFQC